MEHTRVDRDPIPIGDVAAHPVGPPIRWIARKESCSFSPLESTYVIGYFQARDLQAEFGQTTVWRRHPRNGPLPRVTMGTVARRVLPLWWDAFRQVFGPLHVLLSSLF